MHAVCGYSCLFVAVLLLFVAVGKDCVNDMYYVFVLVVGPSWLFRGAATRHFPAGMCAVHVWLSHSQLWLSHRVCLGGTGQVPQVMTQEQKEKADQARRQQVGYLVLDSVKNSSVVVTPGLHMWIYLTCMLPLCRKRRNKRRERRRRLGEESNKRRQGKSKKRRRRRRKMQRNRSRKRTCRW
jgi:hypothetical protein